MSQNPSFSFAQAYPAGNYILELLHPHCTRIHLAGSLRRMKSQVRDIEIVCQPKKETITGGLFDEPVREIISREFTEALMTITDRVIRGSVEGRYMQIQTNSRRCPGIILDLFMPLPDDYFRVYAIRTGSADYARDIIATGWRKLGWVGTCDGLRLQKECSRKGEKWVCTAASPTLPPVWQTEGEFFSWMGLEYVDPELREKPTLNPAA